MKTDNELISEFYEGIVFDEDGYCTNPEQKYSWRPGCYDTLKVENLQYDTSWNWLMPVVTKIYEWGKEKHNGAYLIDDWRRLSDLTIFANREAVYHRVVEFIKWYNENYKSNINNERDKI